MTYKIKEDQRRISSDRLCILVWQFSRLLVLWISLDLLNPFVTISVRTCSLPSYRVRVAILANLCHFALWQKDYKKNVSMRLSYGHADPSSRASPTHRTCPNSQNSIPRYNDRGMAARLLESSELSSLAKNWSEYQLQMSWKRVCF